MQQIINNTNLDILIENKLNQQSVKVYNWNNFKRLNYISKLKVIKKFSSKNIYSKGVFVLNNYWVSKTLYNNASGLLFWKNEINALKRVLGNNHFPQLIAADPGHLIIYMTYCGTSLEDGAQVPTNWKHQARQIKNFLLKKQINPNDILPRNICVQNNIIKIIDFGLSNIRYNETIKSIDKLYSILQKYSLLKKLH